ncbi:MAG: hypothetical protein MI757_05315 [Pirellulales bacterium]|nr:hypothetical protein [Pirellulales bacterium]
MARTKVRDLFRARRGSDRAAFAHRSSSLFVSAAAILPLVRSVKRLLTLAAVRNTPKFVANVISVLADVVTQCRFDSRVTHERLQRDRFDLACPASAERTTEIMGRGTLLRLSVDHNACLAPRFANDVADPTLNHRFAFVASVLHFLNKRGN